MTFWQFWDAGGNWLAFLLAFCLIESPGLCGHHTMSETLRHWARAEYGWLFIVAFQALALYLFYHFYAGR